MDFKTGRSDREKMRRRVTKLKWRCSDIDKVRLKEKTYE